MYIILNLNNDVNEFPLVHNISARSVVVIHTSEVYQRSELPRTESGEFSTHN